MPASTQATIQEAETPEMLEPNVRLRKVGDEDLFDPEYAPIYPSG